MSVDTNCVLVRYENYNDQLKAEVSSDKHMCYTIPPELWGCGAQSSIKESDEDAHLYDNVCDRLQEQEYYREHLRQFVMIVLEFDLLG